MAALLLKSLSCGEPVPLVVPVCPDYPEDGYELGDGVSRTAQRFLGVLPSLQKLFTDRGFTILAEIDVADVEIFDPIISRRLAMTTDEFFRRTNHTIEAICKEVLCRGLSDSVTVGSMQRRFETSGADYALRQKELVQQLLGHSGRKVRQVREALVKERIASGDYQDLQLATEAEFREAAAYELGGYAVYGELVGSSVLICSPEAQSAIPAYNMLKRHGSHISPTALIKPPRRPHGSFFTE